MVWLSAKYCKLTWKLIQQLFCENVVQLLFFLRTDTWGPMDHNHLVRMSFDCCSNIPLFRYFDDSDREACTAIAQCVCRENVALEGLGTKIILCICHFIVVLICSFGYFNDSVHLPCNCFSFWGLIPWGLGITIIQCVCRLIIVLTPPIHFGAVTWLTLVWPT